MEPQVRPREAQEPPKRSLWSAKGAALRAKRSQDERQDGAKAVQVRKSKLLKLHWFL